MGIARGKKIVTDGLVLHLDAANKSSYPSTGNIWTDLSGNRNNGTLTNGLTFDSSNNGSIVFDGSNEYIDLDLNLLNSINTDEGTLEFFVKTEQGNVVDAIIGFWDSSNFNVNRGAIYIGNSTTAYSDELFSYYSLGNNGNFGIVARDSSVSSEYSLLDGNFHHFVIVIKPNNYAMYLDNISQNFSYRYGNASSTGTFLNVPNLDTIRIGVESVNGGRFYYNGNMFNIKIYNRALTSSEVLQNYNAIKSRFGL